MEVKYRFRSLTLKQRCCRGYSLRDSIHTVDGLEELWDTIILVRYQHLNLIRSSIREERRGGGGVGNIEPNKLTTKLT